MLTLFVLLLESFLNAGLLLEYCYTLALLLKYISASPISSQFMKNDFGIGGISLFFLDVFFFLQYLSIQLETLSMVVTSTQMSLWGAALCS